MGWLQIVITMVSAFVLGLFMKNYFPAYMDKKGENLATKEDIAEITRKTEEVQSEFKEQFQLFSSDLKFKYDFFYRQYAELYSNLYAIIMQSEYIRRFMLLNDGKNVPFEEVPFWEISPTHKISQHIEFGTGKPLNISQTEEQIKTPLSECNKAQLCDYIINNGSLATQKLLKLAMSYRFAYNFYSGNPDVKNSDSSKVADEEEFRLIREIVCCIVSEYNCFRKELKMNYSPTELETGIPTL
jgi:hypothetical protein